MQFLKDPSDACKRMASGQELPTSRPALTTGHIGNVLRGLQADGEPKFLWSFKNSFENKV